MAESPVGPGDPRFRTEIVQQREDSLEGASPMEPAAAIFKLPPLAGLASTGPHFSVPTERPTTMHTTMFVGVDPSPVAR